MKTNNADIFWLIAPVTVGILAMTTPPISRVLLPCDLDTLTIQDGQSVLHSPLDVGKLVSQ